MSVPLLLTGIRVLDLADSSAVLAARILADLGADVIRVEQPDGGEVRRRLPYLDHKTGVERSLHHHHYNRNKRSVVLDLARPEDRDSFLRLAAGADALIETAPPGLMDSLGIGYEAVRPVNAGLVYATVTPFGQSGPFRDYKGDDLIGAAAGGLLYLNGFPDEPPVLPGGEQAYKMASLVAASSVLMAIVGRERDPGRRGRRIDISIQEAASMATVQTANANIYSWHGRVPGRAGNTSGIHRCKDGKWISFVLRTGVQETWDDLAAWLREEHIESPVLSEEWRDQSFRIQNRGAVGDAIAKLCAKHDRSLIFHEGQRRKQLVMPVNAVDDLLQDEQLQHRSFFVSIENAEMGRTFVDAGLPYNFSDVTTRPHRRAPLLGEHNQEVMSTLPRSTSGLLDGSNAPAEGCEATRPLQGIRVADFSWMIAGPASSRMLADFGAEVIKIESEYRVDNIRIVGVQPPGIDSLDTNGVFNDCNTNKLSLRLNMNRPEGIELVRKIIERSDIVLNNYTAARMPRWGLGYDDLKEIKPDIIMLSMPVMGSTGPYRNYGAYGNGVIAFGGLNMITGSSDRPPVGLGPLYSDFAAPYLVVTSIMAALYHREKTGKGQFIDFSQAEATVSLLGPAILEYTANSELPARKGNRSDESCPHGVYPCFGSDRWCAIAVASDPEWATLCEAIGLPKLARDGRFASFEARKANEGELDAILSRWTRERDAWQVMHALQARGLKTAVVEDLEDMAVRDPWLSREHLVSVPFGEQGIAFRTHAQPLRIDGRLPSIRRAPVFGEHSEEVLKGLLGLSEEEFERLLVDQVVY